MSITVVANTVSMDEACYGLSEVNLQSGLPGKGWRRYQVLYVIRNDRLAEHKRDMGPAKRFKVDQFRIPGGVTNPTNGHFEIVHTVGELIDVADYLRIKPPDFENDIVRTDLVQGYHDTLDLRRRQRKGQSTIGVLARVQRST